MEEPPILPLPRLPPWDFVTLLEEDLSTAIDNIHKQLVEIKVQRIVPEIFWRIEGEIHRLALLV